MTWTPRNQVVDLTQIVDNLLTFVDDNQTDVLAWAGTGLDDFKGLYSNAAGRLGTLFPSLMVLAQASETDLTGDALVAGLELTLEVTVTGPNADELVSNTKRYAMAVESILANIPSADLTANSAQTITASLFEVKTVYDILRGSGSKTANSWMQIFQTRALYKLVTSAF